MIKQFVKDALAGKINLVEHTEKALKEAEEINKEYRYITAYADAITRAKELQEQVNNKTAKGKLFGVLISVKDSICVKDVETTASSAILKGYKPVFNATVIQKCLDEGAIILAKTVIDEFGFGGFSTNVGKGYQKPLNPNDKKRTTGGSSGGAAGLTKKASFPHIALGESTGGSIVNPASFCGVVGLCPTYGRVSRYGLIDYGNSLDKIGTMAQTVEDAALLLEVISGKDEKDSTSSDQTVQKYSDAPGAINGLKIGIIKEAYGEGIDNNVRKTVLDAVYKLEQKGARKLEISMPLSMNYGIPTYFTLAPAEASTNLAKYCGIRYGASEQLTGTYNEYFSRVRNNNFGEEAKRRVLLGTFARMAGYRDEYYTKAAKIRTKIIQEYQNAFEQVDVIITPTVPMPPPTFDEIKKLTPLQHFMIDLLTVSPNLAGLPHITIPCGEANGLPIGMMITGPHFKEEKIIQVAKAWTAK
ncbi:aspartyl/glutamyl-tRNA amidotransferase subunit A [Candidatus Woesearchaeota archaeon]|nr:aspartyl/glutamyl-tRNA amidotransferase subunit A [Candidatus Woesearchaeota archaeon]